MCEKQFPNGTKTTYRYDRKDQLTELLHQDQGGILDRYTYLYDLLGHKTGITKERRGWSVRADSTVMGMMPLAGCQRSKRTERSRHGMVMMPLETVHGKKKAGNESRRVSFQKKNWRSWTRREESAWRSGTAVRLLIPWI